MNLCTGGLRLRALAFFCARCGNSERSGFGGTAVEASNFDAVLEFLMVSSCCVRIVDQVQARHWLLGSCVGVIIDSVCWDAEVGHAQAMVFSDECGRLCDLSEAPWLSCTVGGPKKNKNSKRGVHWRADGNPGKRLRSEVPASPATIAFDQQEGVADEQQGDVDSVLHRNTFDDPEGDALDEAVSYTHLTLPTKA